MDTKLLVEKNIKEGKKLLENLDAHEYHVNAALWFFDQNSDTWKYIVSTPKVDKEGTLKVYKEIQNLLQESKQDIALKDISVVSPTNSLVRVLQSAISTAPKGISGIRFSRNTINNFFIEDAYIYRIAK
jgi:hypothetical protein